MASIILSFIAGSAFTFLVLMYLGNRQIKKRMSGVPSDSEMDKALDSVELMGSIKYRFKQVSEITEAQYALLSQVSRPSASAAHSKYKNDIVGQLRKMEQDKIDIFKSILKDGVDPMIGMIVEGGEQKTVRMSEAVAIYESNNNTYPTRPAKTDPISLRKGLHIVANNEEKNDEPNGPAVP